MSATFGEDADAGVVDEDVEAAEARDRRVDRALDLVVARGRRPAASRRRPGPAASIFGRAADRCASLRPVTPTCTPSATSARAIARPMPRDPPVTSATFPRSDSICHYNSPRGCATSPSSAPASSAAPSRTCSRARDLARVDHADRRQRRRVAAGKALDITQAGAGRRLRHASCPASTDRHRGRRRAIVIVVADRVRAAANGRATTACCC